MHAITARRRQANNLFDRGPAGTSRIAPSGLNATELTMPPTSRSMRGCMKARCAVKRNRVPERIGVGADRRRRLARSPAGVRLDPDTSCLPNSAWSAGRCGN